MVEENPNPKKEDSKKEDSKKGDSFDKLLNKKTKTTPKKKDTSENLDSTISSPPKVNSSSSTQNVINFTYQPTIKVVALLFFTCGIYGLFLLYKHVEIIQAQSEDNNDGLINPIVAVLLSLFTCGLGGLYFNYKVPERAAYITRKTGGNTNPNREGIKPPMKELPVIALFGGVFWIFTDIIGLFFTASVLIWILLPVELLFWSWIFLSIQRSVEYMACIREPEQ